MILNSVHLTLNVVWREVGGTDLLGDTACLASLYVCFSQFVKNFGFAHIDVTEDANDWASQLRFVFGFISFRFESGQFFHVLSLSCESICLGPHIFFKEVSSRFSFSFSFASLLIGISTVFLTIVLFFIIVCLCFDNIFVLSIFYNFNIFLRFYFVYNVIKVSGLPIVDCAVL